MTFRHQIVRLAVRDIWSTSLSGHLLRARVNDLLDRCHLHFKLTYSLQGMRTLRQDELPATCSVDVSNAITFWSREFQHDGKAKRDLCVDLIALRSPPVRVSETLQALRRHRLLLDVPAQEGLPYHSVGDGEIVDEKGNVKPNWMVPYDLLPKGAKPWLRQLKWELSELLTEFIRVLRWRQAASGAHRPFGMIGFYWSDDGETWSHIPTEYQGFVSSTRGFDVGPRALAEAADLLAAQNPEPFAHELIREARDVASSAPRSALLIAFSALETGLKAHIAGLLSGSDTLLAKLPSPPVITLLNEVIPEIHSRVGVETKHLPLAKPAGEFLKKWVTQRNQTAHGVKKTVDGGELRDLIHFVSDILYILDACRGREWALNNLSSAHFTA